MSDQSYQLRRFHRKLDRLVEKTTDRLDAPGDLDDVELALQQHAQDVREANKPKVTVEDIDREGDEQEAENDE